MVVLELWTRDEKHEAGFRVKQATQDILPTPNHNYQNFKVNS